MRLTPRQRMFVEQYPIDMNATQAALRAGFSADTAKAQGTRLLRDPTVAAALTTALAARSVRTRLDADWLLKRLAREAEADLADLYDDDGQLRRVRDWPMIWRQGLVQGVETIRRRDGDDVWVVDKLKLADRGKRLEMIGRHVDVQAFKDRVEHDVATDIAVLIAARRQQVAGGRDGD